MVVFRYEIRSDDESAAPLPYDGFLATVSTVNLKFPFHVKQSSAKIDADQHGKLRRGRCLFLALAQRVMT